MRRVYAAAETLCPPARVGPVLASLLIGAAMLCPTAHANVTEASLTAALGATMEACAVEVTIDAVEDDLVNLSEALLVDDTEVGTFASISPTLSGISRRDSVLFGSPAFEAWAEFTPDVVISDADCLRVMAGARLTFRGSFGNDAATMTLPSDFGLQTAYDGSDLVDLETDGLELNALNGVVLLGIALSGGCSSSGLAPGLAISLLALGTCARRRRS